MLRFERNTLLMFWKILIDRYARYHMSDLRQDCLRISYCNVSGWKQMDPSRFFNYVVPIKNNVLSLSYLYLHGKSRRHEMKGVWYQSCLFLWEPCVCLCCIVLPVCFVSIS